MRDKTRRASAAAIIAVMGLAWASAPALAQEGPPGRGGPPGPPMAQAATPEIDTAAINSPRTEAGYTAPRLAIGQPDLTGVWSNASNTRLTRPGNMPRLVMSDAENERARAANPSNIRQANDDNQNANTQFTGKDLASGRGYNAFWIDPGTNYGNVKGTWRTSWIVEPANGQVPFRRDRPQPAGNRQARGSGYDNPEERSLGERCIVGFGGTSGPPLNNVLYNNNYQIIQSPDAVVIVTEMVHDARIVRLNARHRPPEVNQYMGDSIGWWEGDTLVVETVNQHPGGGSMVQLSDSGKIIERFTRYNDRQIFYEFEVDDPSLYTQVWRGQMSLNASPAIYEYACHEGNYGLHGILSGGRENDRRGVSNVRSGDRDEG
jgi:hypothetical protein